VVFSFCSFAVGLWWFCGGVEVLLLWLCGGVVVVVWRRWKVWKVDLCCVKWFVGLWWRCCGFVVVLSFCSFVVVCGSFVVVLLWLCGVVVVALRWC